MDWNKFAKDVHQVAVDKGLWDKPRTFDDIVCECLVHLGRAYEEHCNGRPNYYHLCEPSGDKRHPCDWDLGKPCPLATGELTCEHRDPKPEGVAVELADCVLRLLDYLAISEEGPMLPIEPLVPGGDFAKVIEAIIKDLDAMAEGCEEGAKDPVCADMVDGLRQNAKTLREAIALLRTHPDAQPNEPLTLEELRGIDGKPVYVVDRVYPPYSRWWIIGWTTGGCCVLAAAKNRGTQYIVQDYGIGWVAYRRPPKEEV